MVRATVAKKPTTKTAAKPAATKKAAKPAAAKKAAKPAVVKKAAKPAAKKAAPKPAAKKAVAAKKAAKPAVDVHVGWEKTGPTRVREEQILREAVKGKSAVVVGVDEAGRGPLAGPVVVSACRLPEELPEALKNVVTDSKKITKESKREEVYAQLVEVKGLQYTVAVVSAGHIDSRNILQATFDGMTRCVDMFVKGVKARESCGICTVADIEGDCHTTPGQASALRKTAASRVFALIDGNATPKNTKFNSEAIVKGDAKELCISAASIIAKVTRDRLMNALCTVHPQFRFSSHKGYPTASHRDLLMSHGACEHHRRSYAPVKAAIAAFTKQKAKDAARDKAKTKTKLSTSPKKAGKAAVKKASKKPATKAARKKTA